MAKHEMVNVPTVNDETGVIEWAEAVAHNAACMAVAPDADERAFDVARMVFSSDAAFALAVVSYMAKSGMVACTAHDAMRAITETMYAGARHNPKSIGRKDGAL